MHFPTLLSLTLASTVLATPYHGQYNYPTNINTTTIAASSPAGETYVYPTSPPTKSPTAAGYGYGYPHPLTNSSSTATTIIAHGVVVHPSGTAAPSSSSPTSSLVPFTGAAVPKVKGASLALVLLGAVVVVWF